MADEKTDLLLRQTKLHRQSITGTFVPRLQLLERLNQGLQRQLTLISAPAGYGKTTMVSSWLEACDYPSAWVSLDKYDNDPRLFLSYCIAAIQTIFPDTCTVCQSMLSAPELPPLKILADNLSNELDQIDQAFILALDDYHVIHKATIHELLIEIMRRPPRNLQLVLASRVDPPLPLARLRARNQMTEIRAENLRFSREETSIFLEQELGVPLEDIAVTILEEKTEGWITGLRLAALSLKYGSDTDHIITDLPTENRYVTDYLLAEVLSNQTEENLEYLLATAILDRFCAPLCDAVCVSGFQSWECKMGGQHFLEWLQKSDLFLVPLDKQGTWFCYHHLFQKLLQRQLKHRLDADEISALQRRASCWFAENNLIDEALQYTLASGDVSSAAQLVEQNRHIPLNKDKWFVLEKWLSKIPDSIVQQRPELLMAKTWVLYFRYELWAVSPLLETIETQHGKTVKELPRGEIDLLNGILMFWEGQGKRAIELLDSALEQIPAENIGVRNELEIYLTVSHQITGQGKTATQMLWRKISHETSEGTRKLRLLASLIFIYLLSGELLKADEVLWKMKDMATKTSNVFVGTWASYILGIIQYQWNNLEEASHHFSHAVENRFILDAYTDIDSYAGLSLSYRCMQQPDKTNKTINRMMEYAQEATNPVTSLRARSAQVRLCLLQGDLESALCLLETADFSFDTGTMLFWLEVPRITQCRVLVAHGSEASLLEAAEKLNEHLQFSKATHNTTQMIDILLLQTMACQKQGQTDEALSVLEQAVILARPGRYIRPFVDQGTEMADLLKRLIQNGKTDDYILRILAAFDGYEIPTKRNKPSPHPDQQSWMRNQALDTPLSNRELEILSFLRQGLQNKEIAAMLFISPETVKKHTGSIYRKLDSHNRQQAVTKAYQLGVLIPDK